MYIREAHASNEWPVGGTPVLAQPESLAERQAVARRFIQEQGCSVPLLIDSMDNAFDRAFGCWPVRFFVIQKGILTYKAEPNSRFTYSHVLEELNDRFVDYACGGVADAYFGAFRSWRLASVAC